MKHRTEIIITTIITILICFVAVPVGVNYAFRYEAPVDILAARWKASDALNYIATVLAFIGTFFLGLVAWKQNTDLKKIETNMFIANNSCEVFLESIELKSLNQIACNLATEHMESIVVEEGIQGLDYRSYQIAICLKRKSGFSTQVRVNDMAIFIGDETTTIPIWTKRYDDNAVKVLTGRKEYSYCKGLDAYDAWKEALQQDNEFTVMDNLFVLFEKMLCQMDAMSCITDGRTNAARYFSKLAETDVMKQAEYNEIAEAFTKCAKTIEKMWSLFGDTSDMEGMLTKLADKSVRVEVCKLIDIARTADGKALELIKCTSDK